MRRATAGSLFSLFIALILVVPASAQPFDAWLQSTPGHATTHGFIQIPHHASLNPTMAITIEAWVLSNLTDGGNEDCRSLIGKGFEDAWWVGVCNVSGVRTLRTYVRGSGSPLNGGRIPNGQWTHIALTYGGGTRRHYINGELVATQALAGNLTTNSDPVRILSDVDWQFSPAASIDEVRLWNVVRTEAQIRAALNVRVTTAQPGLVAVWPLDGNGNDVIGPRDGALQGTGVNFFIGAVASDCGTQTDTALCLADRFQVTARWRTGPPGTPDNPAMTIPCGGPICENSGIFWFFQDVNWELMVKVLNGCTITNHYWVFNAGLTNVFFRLEVTDVANAETKIYFNYQGPPAPAITDTSAFATCP